MNKRVLHIVITVLLLTAASVYSTQLSAQIKVGQNPTTINPNALIDLESNNKGLLLPRLALTAVNDPAPLSAFVKGMLVFNTATVGSLLQGLYYCDGTKWVFINPITPSGGALPNETWSTTGNTGTNASHFLGTTDFAPLVIKTNNTERLRVTEDGWIGIGTAVPTAALQIKGQLVIDSLTAGNTATDSFLVANPADGRVKMVSAKSFVTGQRKNLTVVTTNGQTIFNTPAVISDINKITMYRNGVLISCTQNNTNSVIAEVACMADDEIRIIQLL
jgi:hypothetical protein